MKLYTFSIYGQKFYAIGTLSQEEVEKVQKKCAEICKTHKAHWIKNPKTVFAQLLSTLQGISSVEVEHIFRINYP